MTPENKRIFSYIGPGLIRTVIAALLLAAALVCAAVAIGGGTSRVREPAPFDALDTKADGPLYLDVVGVSDPMTPPVAGRSYYLVEDSAHLFRIVSLTEGEYAAMGTQSVYWNSPDMPESPVRLLGVSVPIPETAREAVIGVFEMSEESFDNNFGARCFLTESPEARSNAGVWTLWAVLCALGFAAAFTLWLPCFLSARTAIARLEALGCAEPAAAALDAGAGRVQTGKAFLFARRAGLAAAWGDVIWCYGRTLALGRLSLARLLVIATADGRQHHILFGAKEEKALRGLTAELKKHQPALLLGESAENRRAWRRACG